MASRFAASNGPPGAVGRRSWLAVAVAVIMVGSTLGVIGFVTAASTASPAPGPAASSSPVNSPGPSTTLLATPTETLIPTSGPPGTAVTLTGTGLSDSTVYYYCFETANTHIGCPTTLSFTTNATGVIPSGVSFTLETAEYVVIATGTVSSDYVTDAHFTLQTMDVVSGMVPYVIAQSEFAFMFTNEGPTAGNLTLNLTLYLAMTNLPYLNLLASEVNTPGTPLFHHYLTPSQFQAEFYPSNSTISSIESYYRQHGFKVWSEPYAPLVIVLSANVTTIDAQFDVTLYNYNVNSTYAELENSYTYDVLQNPVITNNANPSVPSTYASDITTIYGMSYASDIDLEKSAITACSLCSQSGTPAGTQPGQGGVLYAQDSQSAVSAGAGSSSLLTPANLESYFQISSLLSAGYNGTGQKTAVVGVGENFQYSALQAYWANYGIVPHSVNLINLSANGINQGISNTEQALDLEWTVAIAPGATTYDVQEAYNITTLPHNGQGGSLGDDSIVMEIYYILNEIDPNTITSSWGMLQFQHDDSWAIMYTQMSLQAVVQGVTYFEGSSDSHSIYYMISEQTPYFMAVGGTDPVLSSTGVIEGQYAWYEPSGSFYGLQVGSGGGSSFFYPKPAYQVDETVSVPASYLNRSEPDMSFPAEDLSTSTRAGSYSGGGGTSYSAPILAAAFADAESMMAARYGNGQEQYQLGWIQPMLYNLGYGTTYGYTAYQAISELQVGGTIQDGSYLGNGWNEWEGLGTPWMLNLTYDMMNYIAPETITATLTSDQIIEGGSTRANLVVSNFGAPIQTVASLSLGGSAIRSWNVVVNAATQSVAINTSGLLPGEYAVSFSYQSGAGIASVASVEFEVADQTFPVTFSETGLPTGTTWYVNGTTQNQFVPGANLGADSTSAILSAGFTNGTIPYTVASSNKDYATEPVHGSILVTGAPESGPVFVFTLQLFSVTFTETGLAPGTSWSVTVNGVYHISTTSTIVFSEANATYSYSVASINGKTATPATGMVTVHGTTSGPVISFSGLAYTVSFTEVGLPPSTSWSSTLNGSTQSSTSSTISFGATLPGTYAYSIAPKAGYTTSPLSGNVTVVSGAVNVQVTFTKLTYAVTFAESGLPASTMWAVTFTGVLGVSTTSSIVFHAVNGSGYTYKIASESGYTVAATPSTVTVAGAPVTVTVTFTPEVVKYTVFFTESGLPSGTPWSITVSPSGSASGTTPTLSFLEANGTYNGFTFMPSSGYTAVASVSSIVISGSSVSIGVTFSPIVYTVTFTETGLTGGTLWAVVLNGVIASSTTATITFSVINGVYSYTVGYEVGYTSTTMGGPSSPLTVSGGSVAVTITFTAIPIAHGTVGLSTDATALMRPAERYE